MEVRMEPAVGPVLPQPISSPADMAALTFKPDTDAFFKYLYDAITLTRRRISAEPDLRAVPLIGFCGAPWTLMAYMVEGGGSKGHEKCRTFLYKVRGVRERGVVKTSATVRSLTLVASSSSH
jgi:uroporphyrinogen decarboxylase